MYLNFIWVYRSRISYTQLWVFFIFQSFPFVLVINFHSFVFLGCSIVTPSFSWMSNSHPFHFGCSIIIPSFTWLFYFHPCFYLAVPLSPHLLLGCSIFTPSFIRLFHFFYPFFSWLFHFHPFSFLAVPTILLVFQPWVFSLWILAIYFPY